MSNGNIFKGATSSMPPSAQKVRGFARQDKSAKSPKIGKLPERSGKSKKDIKDKRRYRDGRVHIGKPPHLKTSRLVALDSLSLTGTESRTAIRATLSQRAENGALDPSSLALLCRGAPIFNPEAPKPYFEGFQSDLGPKRRSNDDGSNAPFSAL